MADRPNPRRGASRSRLIAAAAAVSAGLALVGGMNVAAHQAEQASTASAPVVRRVVVVPEVEPLVVVVPTQPSTARPSTEPVAPVAPSKPTPQAVQPVTESGGS